MATPQLHALANTWSSCVEQPIQRIFLALCASQGLTIYGGDVTDAYAHSPSPEVPTYLSIDDAYADWYEKKFKKTLNRRWVLPIQHSLQGHPESGKMWMRMIDRILNEDLGFTITTHDRCIYTKQIYNLLFKSCRIAPQCLRKTKSQQSTRRLFYIDVLFTSVHLQICPL
jgi:hypothetical protein